MSRAPLLVVVVVVAVAESRLAFHLASDMGCACLSLYLSVCVCAPSGMMTAYCECQWTSIAGNFHVIVCCCCLTLLLKLLFESLLLSLSLLPLSSNWQAIFCPGCEYTLMAICLLPVAESSQKLMQNTRRVSSAWAFRMNIRNRIRIVFVYLFVWRVTKISFPDFP